MPTALQPRLYTLSHVARVLGLTRAAVRDLIEAGEIRTVRFGPSGGQRVPAEEVERLIAGR